MKRWERGLHRQCPRKFCLYHQPRPCALCACDGAYRVRVRYHRAYSQGASRFAYCNCQSRPRLNLPVTHCPHPYPRLPICKHPHYRINTWLTYDAAPLGTRIFMHRRPHSHHRERHQTRTNNKTRNIELILRSCVCLHRSAADVRLDPPSLLKYRHTAKFVHRKIPVDLSPRWRSYLRSDVRGLPQLLLVALVSSCMRAQRHKRPQF